ncbi:MAG: hypothetical protein MJ247_02900 [Alphaproteobacteria bacterium]|nr:hypothetical protein [Alphaproteobacteria bacterium]
MRSKKASLNCEEKNQCLAILVALVCLFGFIYFFEDNDIIFSCNYDEQECKYFHSTYYNSKIRYVKSYSLIGIDDVDIKKHVTHSRSGSRTYYTINFYEGNKSKFSIGNNYHFDFDDDALSELLKIKKSLFEKKSEYTFQKIGIKNVSSFIVPIVFILSSLFFIILGFLFIKKGKEKILMKKRRNI